MTTPTATLLAADDHCRRAAALSLRWQPSALPPREILSRAIRHGLESPSADWGQAAADFAMSLCCENIIDTPQYDLLGLAEHLAALAELCAWILRTDAEPWQRPAPAPLGHHFWHSGCWLAPSGISLRALHICDRWDALAEAAAQNSWAVAAESAIYSLPVDVLAVCPGQLREGRWHSPLTRGWRHPQAATLRFLKRDGGQFSSAWERVWREHDSATRDEWLETMTEDGVLTDAVRVFHVEHPARAAEWRALVESKLDRILAEAESSVPSEPPEPQPSQCFSRLRPCQFRACCPVGELPGAELGFTQIR